MPKNGRLTSLQEEVKLTETDQDDSSLSSDSSWGQNTTKGIKSKFQVLTEQANKIHATEKAKRAFEEEELAMYQRIMNKQQLKTYLVTKDLTEEKNFRELAVAFEVNKKNI